MEAKYARLLLLAPLAAVLLVSGCVGGGTVTSGNGVIILDFKPDFTNVYSEDSVKLQLRVQNQGATEARNVETELTNIDATDWDSSSPFQSNFDLIPYDPATNTPGEIRTLTWSMNAPELAKGTMFTYEPMVKVSYDYTTVAQKPITLVDADELRKIIQQGKTLPSKTTTYTAGPLAVEVKTGNYVRTSGGGISGGESYDVFPVYIKITNTGWESGGTVVKDGMAGGGFGEEFDYPVEVTITEPNGISMEECNNYDVVDLWQGKDAEITCNFRVTNPPAFRQEALFTITLEYRYQAQASTSVQVSGTDRY